MKRIILYNVALVIVFLNACTKDFVVKDITSETVITLSPAEGTNTPNNNITFWWEEVDGAESYDVQIVSPSFSSIQQLISDTSVKGDKFTKILQPGSYQWRIRGVNNGGTTGWTTRTLAIDTSSNLSYSAVILLSPADSFYTNQLTHIFSWSPVSNATTYNVNILGNNYTYSTTSASFTFSAEGAYTWKVRAENSFSFSPYSTRTIIIDQTAPSAPSLSYPADNANNVPSDTTFRWVKQTDAYKDIILISDVSDFSTTVKLDTILNYNGSIRTYDFSFFGPVSGTTYYWKVKSMDKARNLSNYSTARSFSVQ